MLPTTETETVEQANTKRVNLLVNYLSPATYNFVSLAQKPLTLGA